MGGRFLGQKDPYPPQPGQKGGDGCLKPTDNPVAHHRLFGYPPGDNKSKTGWGRGGEKAEDQKLPGNNLPFGFNLFQEGFVAEAVFSF